MADKETLKNAAIEIIKAVGLPRLLHNDRSAYCLLVMAGLKPGMNFQQVSAPLLGITPIMNLVLSSFELDYKPNTRETIRDETVKMLCNAGLALLNPDKPSRPINSPKTVYQLSDSFLNLISNFSTSKWELSLKSFLEKQPKLTDIYAEHRSQVLIPVKIANDKFIDLSPGAHSQLIKEIIEEFGRRFIPGGTLVYVGDTGKKWGYFDEQLLRSLSVEIGSHGKMPDVVILDTKRNWLFLIESVTSSGPIDGRRKKELEALFEKSKAGIVLVTAFPNRALMSRYFKDLAWEAEVWISEDPSHMIHLNGSRFLGPYAD